VQYLSKPQAQAEMKLVNQFLCQVNADDRPPKTERELAEFARRVGFRFEAPIDDNDEDASLKYGQAKVTVNRSELRLAVSLGIINSRLPSGSRRVIGDELNFTPSDDSSRYECGVRARKWLALLKEHWREIELGLKNPEVNRAWIKAWRTNQSSNAEQRAINLYRELTSAGLDASLAQLLVLTQVPAKIDNLEALEGKLPIRRYG